MLKLLKIIIMIIKRQLGSLNVKESSEDMVNVYSAHVLGHDSLFLSLSLNSSKRTKGTFTSGQDDHSVVEAQLEKRS